MAKASDNEFPSVLFGELASAPTTPATGKWRLFTKSDGVYVVDDTGAVTGPFGGGGGGGAAGTVGGPAVVVRKTANESVTSSTTLQDDNHLVQAIGASEVWAVEFVLYVTGEDAGDLLVDVAAPAGATGVWGVVAPGVVATTDTASPRNRGNIGMTTGGIGVGVIDSIVSIVQVHATVTNSTTPGDIKLRWAQATSNGTATVVNAGSVMRSHRIA